MDAPTGMDVDRWLPAEVNIAASLNPCLISWVPRLTKASNGSIVPMQSETSLGEAAARYTGHCPETSRDAKG
jgi:hypothetical protein